MGEDGCSLRNHIRQIGAYYARIDIDDGYVQVYGLISLLLISGAFIADTQMA